MAKRKCFVIMPIGKEGSEEFKHFRSVFDVIIKPAVEQSGYDVRRADDSAFMGNINNEVVESLATADLVIADLTDRNANVYLELGIRHCLQKSGTIHLIRDDQALPFDVASYRAIKYNTDFDKIDAVREAIAAAIEDKHRRPDAADNPVHDAIDLPQDYRSIAESEQVAELEAAQKKLAAATRELETLKRRFLPKGADVDGDGVDPELLDDRELAARLSNISSQIRDNSLPSQLVVRAQNAAKEGELGDLVSIVEKLLLSPFADPADLRRVARIAGRAGLEELELLMLEQAAAKFPGDSFGIVLFGEVCVHTSDPSIQQRGRKILESNLGIVWKGDKPVFTKGAIPDKDIRVGILLDFYSANDHLKEELAVAQAALEVYGETPVTLRSAGRAYENSGEPEKAEKYYAMAVDADPGSSTSLYWFGNFRLRRREWAEARRLHLKACEADPNDPRRVVSLLSVYATEFKTARNQDDLGTIRDLTVLAIKRSNGSPTVRSECAQTLNGAGVTEIEQLCLDSNWPQEEDVERAETTFGSLGKSLDVPPAELAT